MTTLPMTADPGHEHGKPMHVFTASLRDWPWSAPELQRLFCLDVEHAIEHKDVNYAQSIEIVFWEFDESLQDGFTVMCNLQDDFNQLVDAKLLPESSRCAFREE